MSKSKDMPESAGVESFELIPSSHFKPGNESARKAVRRHRSRWEMYFEHICIVLHER